MYVHHLKIEKRDRLTHNGCFMREIRERKMTNVRIIFENLAQEGGEDEHAKKYVLEDFDFEIES